MESLPLEGGGYGAGLSVGHNLHCIVSWLINLTCNAASLNSTAKIENGTLSIIFLSWNEPVRPCVGLRSWSCRFVTYSLKIVEYSSSLTLWPDHCLDFLRQSILCHVDYSMMTIYWNPEMPDVPTHHPQGTQKCVNWDKLKAWMKPRAVDHSMVLTAHWDLSFVE